MAYIQVYLGGSDHPFLYYLLLMPILHAHPEALWI